MSAVQLTLLSMWFWMRPSRSSTPSAGISSRPTGLAAVSGPFYRKEISRKADIVLVSQGGAPKDLNLYQTQKALENGKYAVKENGIIVLVGSCREGMGERVFEEWMLGADQPSDLIKRIETDFQLGGHKAAAIAMVLEHAKVFLVSHMEEEFVRNIFMTPFSSVQEAVDQAFKELGAEASVLVMPFGGSTLPVVGDT